MRASVRLLPDERRLHLQDGPIDLIVEAFGSARSVRSSYEAAAQRFVRILDELCDELPVLRSQLCNDTPLPRGRTARCMLEAVRPYFEGQFITPMAAVAGAVAEDVLGCMLESADLERAYVNNGGDIAFHLSPGQSFMIGMVDRPDRPSLFGTARLDWNQPVRGIATSGWRGRSFSLGIADAVTVLAQTAAMADAAATIIANAVDLPGHSSVTRVPARQIAPDSDLGEIPVTQAVGHLSSNEIDCALANGNATAELLVLRGLIHSAALRLGSQTSVVTPEEEPTGRLLHV